MRKKLMLLFTLSLLLQCNEKKEVKRTISKEDAFINLINKSNSEYYTQPNDIKREEYFDKYDKKVTDFLLKDSIIVENWNGVLTQLNSESYDTGNVVNFQIEKELKPKSEYENLTFDCSYIATKSQFKNDLLYNKIINLQQYGSVYFTGIFVRNTLNRIVPIIDSYTIIKDSNYFTSPNYKFYVLDISTNKNKKISSNLYEAIKLNRQIFDLLNEKAENRIKEKEWKIKTKELVDREKEFEKKLNADETKINDLSKKYFSTEFM